MYFYLKEADFDLVENFNFFSEESSEEIKPNNADSGSDLCSLNWASHGRSLKI